MRRNFLVGGGLLFGGWLIAVNAGAAYLTRRRKPDPQDSPTNYGIPFQEVQFIARDGVKIAGRWIPAREPACTVILCHGQEGSMDGLTPIMVPLYEANFNVLMFDFRAHGQSEGSSVSMGMYEKEDLLGAIDFLHANYQVESVGVVGFSMGAATALITAALSDRICAIVADSSYIHLRQTLARWGTQRGVPYAIARQIAWGVLSTTSVRIDGRIDQAEPSRWVAHIGQRPILYIYGEADPYITRAEIAELQRLSEGPTDLWLVPNVGHRGAYLADPAGYMERVIAWFQKYLVPA
jgi:pimeloyl-ACP methyl ester carboxylesterase